MIDFFLLIFNVFSKKFIVKMEQKDKVIVLPDFGFEKGGKLLMTIYGLNFSGVKLFVLSPILRELFYRSGNNDFFCTSSVNYFIIEFRPHVEGVRVNSKDFVIQSSNYVNDIYDTINYIEKDNNTQSIYNLLNSNDNYFYNNGIGRIAINVTVPNVYLPILTNCDNHDKMSAVVQYLNNGTFLDTREKNIQSFFTIFLFIYILFFLIWIINGQLYPNFSVKIHRLFAFSCLSKAFSLYCSCLKWKEKRSSESVSAKIIYGEIFSQYFSFVILMASNLITSLGFDIYKSVSSIEIFLIVLISSLIYITIYICEESYIELKIFGLISNLICFLISEHFINIGIESASSSLNIFDNLIFQINSPNFYLKIDLVISFCYAFKLIFLLYMLVFYISLLSNSKMLKVLIRECSEILFYIIDLIYFTYRNSYEPVSEEEWEARRARRRRLAHAHLLQDLNNDDDPSNATILEPNDDEENTNLSTQNCKIVEFEDPNRNEITLLL